MGLGLEWPLPEAAEDGLLLLEAQYVAQVVGSNRVHTLEGVLDAQAPEPAPRPGLGDRGRGSGLGLGLELRLQLGLGLL